MARRKSSKCTETINTMLDIGCGAGFPGLVLKIVFLILYKILIHSFLLYSFFKYIANIDKSAGLTPLIRLA